MSEQKPSVADLMMMIGRAFTEAMEAHKDRMLAFAKAVNENQRRPR